MPIGCCQVSDGVCPDAGSDAAPADASNVDAQGSDASTSLDAPSESGGDASIDALVYAPSAE